MHFALFACHERGFSSGSYIFLHFGKRPVVIVDDSVDDRAWLSLCLRSVMPRETSLVILESGRELLEYLHEIEMDYPSVEEFEAEIPCMIFLDLLMPDINGVETLQIVRSKPIWSDVPVTLITNSLDDDFIQKAEDAGANAFLPKPYTKLDIMQALNRYNNFSSVIL